MARIGLVFGGRSVEHEVSVTSARTVAKGLEAAGHEAVALGIGPDGVWCDRATSEAALAGELDRLPAGGGPVAPSLARLLEAGVDGVFPIVHGTWGEDGTLQGLFEMADLPYVGAGVTASVLAMDKLLTKRQLEAVDIPVVPYVTTNRAGFDSGPEWFLARTTPLGLPLFVKPRAGGSSVGVRKVTEDGALAEAVRFALEFDDGVLVERGIEGRELEVAVLGPERVPDADPEDDPEVVPDWWRGIFRASAVGEIVPGKEFYDYEDKYLSDGARLIAPAELPDGLTQELQQLAVRAFRAIDGDGMARVDFLLDPAAGEGYGEIFVNEINTLPGFTSISMYPRLWGLSGVPLGELVGRLVEIAFTRHRARHRLDRGIREWIAELEARG